MNRSVSLGTSVLAVVLSAVLAVLSTGLVTGSIVLPGGASTAAASPTDATAEPDYLFTQDFQSGTITGANDQNLVLTLTGLRKYLTAFTDRPDRQANLLDAGDFYRLWDTWFAADPPNAVLSYTPEGMDRPIGVVVKLMNPRYFPETDTVAYQAVKIAKSEALVEGAEVTVVAAKGDPDIQDHDGSFGPGTLFIDDATALATSFSGFFNAPSIPSVNDTLSDITVTPSLKLGTVTVTGNANGTLTGTLIASLGGKSGTAPIEMNGSFSWSDSDDWTVTLETPTSSGQTTTVSGTITDTAGAITGTMTMQTVVGDKQVPVSLDLTYDGVGNLAGHGTAADFTIKNSTFSGVTASFTTADPSLALAGTMTTTSTVTTTTKTTSTTGTTDGSTYAFSGSVASGTYSIDIIADLPTGEQGEVTLTGTVGGDLTGSIDLTDAVIGGTKFPSLSLTFDTSHGEIAASGTMETNLGTFSGSFKVYGSKLTNLAFSARDLEYGPGLTIDQFSFTAAFGDAAATCTSYEIVPTTTYVDTGFGKIRETTYTIVATQQPPAMSFSGSSTGKMTIKGANSGTFSNDLKFACGKFQSEEFMVTVNHKTELGTRSLGGIIYFSAEPGTIQPCPATTDPLNNGCGTTVPYIASPITSAGPFFYGSLTYGASVSKGFNFTILSKGLSDTANVEGTIGMGILVYTDTNGEWKEGIGLGGQVGVSLKITYLSATYQGSSGGAAVCTFVTAANDFQCKVAFDAKISGLGSTYTYKYSDTTSF